MIKNSNLYLFLPFLLLLAFSCNKNETSVEVISIEELIGQDVGEAMLDSQVRELPALDGTFISEINQKLYKNFTTKAHTKRTLIDRFSTAKTEKSVFMATLDSSATADFYMYNFADSTSTMNAFNNLLACFGSNCEEIGLSESKTNVNEVPLWCGVFETSIVILKFSPNALAYKNELKQTVFQTKGEALKYTLNVSENKELKWD